MRNTPETKCMLVYMVWYGKSVFPHIHWQMNQVIEGVRTDVCPRDFLTAVEAIRLDSLFTDLGRSPACYATPTVIW